MLEGVLDASQSLRLGGDSSCRDLFTTGLACLALVTELAGGCFRFLFAVVICPADVGKSSVVFLTHEFHEICLIVVVGTSSARK